MLQEHELLCLIHSIVYLFVYICIYVGSVSSWPKVILWNYSAWVLAHLRLPHAIT